MAQYRLPEAQQVHDRKIAHLEATGTPYVESQRREGSPWVKVVEVAA